MQLTPEHEALRGTARRFVAEHINPHVDAWEAAGIFPAHEVFRKMGELGLLGVNKPVDNGGMGLDASYAAVLTEALSDTNGGGVPMAIGVQTDMATPALAARRIDWLGKQKAGRLVREVADGCLQFWGGIGYANESAISRIYRDGRLCSIGGGADEVMLQILCKFMGTFPKLPMITAPRRSRKVLVANRGEIALRVMRTARAARLPHGRRVLQRRCELRARRTGRPGGVHRRAAAGAVVPAHRRHRRGRQAVPAPMRSTRATASSPRTRTSRAPAATPGWCSSAPRPRRSPRWATRPAPSGGCSRPACPASPATRATTRATTRLRAEAERIGYPVMIKATAGGGGRGMRLVPSAREFGDLLRSARSEAQSAFGDSTVILERAIVEPRHIEIQVFADRHGNAIHLGERDCSVQRRHQKVIEEAPSPAVSVELRERMGATAVAAAQAIGYEGAGTLEFLLDRDGNFYFMEMNTRLQVEHPVTEAITGLDLVELQLRVAAGEPLPLAQARRALRRACDRAAAVRRGRRPRASCRAAARWGCGRRPRVCASSMRCDPAREVPPYYDSMIAKIIGHGRTRDEARRKLLRGLEDLVALGVTTNQAFLARCLTHPVFAAGGATTAFIAQQAGVLLAPPAESYAQRARPRSRRCCCTRPRFGAAKPADLARAGPHAERAAALRPRRASATSAA